MSSEERYPTRNTQIDEKLLHEGLNKMPQVLAELGFSGLREGQDKVIYNILAGNDTLCILPTGAGKSLCYTVPTLCHSWKTLVFSPLVALMRDQVQSLQRKNVAAAQVSSTQTEAENIQAMKDWSNGHISLLFVAPERLDNQMFRDVMKLRPPDFCAMDESHTMSSDGDSFRPAYKKVGDFLREHPPKVVAAFSATVTSSVEADIRQILGLANAPRLRYYPRRENLLLSSSDLQSEMEIVDYVNKCEGTTLIYCSTIKRLEALTGTLQALCNEPIGYYHGELPPAMKRSTQDAFMEDKIRVMVATSAFGMGIDKGSVRHVLQRDIEASIEATVQALGRGGRDGKITHCHTYYSPDSLRTQQFFLGNKYPDLERISSVYDALREAADDHGRCYISFKDLSVKTGLMGMAIDPIIAILTGDNVVKRSKEKDSTCNIYYTGINGCDPRFEAWKEIIYEGGVPNGKHIEIELDWLVEKLGYSGPATVRKWLKQWDDEGLIEFTPPVSRPPLEITGTLQNVDFGRLARKAKEAIVKLQDVLEYCSTPDPEKHAFVESRFGVERK